MSEKSKCLAHWYVKKKGRREISENEQKEIVKCLTYWPVKRREGREERQVRDKKKE